MVRVAAYVDGFNLYFGLKARHGRKYLWLDLQALALSLVRPGQTLDHVTYFTARVRNDPEGLRRQSDYLDALASHSPLVTVVNGRFQEKPPHCRKCGAAWTVYEEKETDVSIAAALIEEAVLDRYDTANSTRGTTLLRDFALRMKPHDTVPAVREFLERVEETGTG